MKKQRRVMPADKSFEGVRVRYLIREDTGPFSLAEWQRVSAMRWRRFRGEKKIVTGKTTVIYLAGATLITGCLTPPLNP